MSGKKIHRSSQIGDHGVALIHTRVSEMGLVWHERRIDAGIDGVIELRDPATGEVANRSMLVQSKASERQFPGESDARFHYLCEERDLEYWMRADRPVLLICSHPSAQQAWWVHVQAWFADPARRASRRVDFDKATQSFDAKSAPRLFAIADPTGSGHTPVREPRAETLISNLLPVTVPTLLYSGPVSVQSERQVKDVLRSQGNTRRDWLIRNGHIYSFATLEELGLAGIATGPGARDHPTAFARSDPERQQFVIQLLNNTFREDLHRDLAWSQWNRYAYFKAPRPPKERGVRGPYGKLREVVSVHRNKTKGHIAYYKHMALRWQFHLVDDEWYIDLNPDYHYTRDGMNESRKASDLRAGLKRIEKHEAVRGQLEFWAHHLRPEVESLLGVTARMLTFGPLITLAVDYGINDSAWWADRSASRPQPPSTDREPNLFDDIT